MEKPILFSTAMVKAVNDDRKTKTRRLNGLKEINKNPDKWSFDSMKGILESGECRSVAWFENKITGEQVGIICPYEIGMILWVRETWCHFPRNAPDGMGGNIYYKASQNNPPLAEEIMKANGVRWKPSIHMPKEACRIRLEITDIKVEQLQDITAEDAMAEGIKLSCKHEGYVCSAYPCNFKRTHACKDYFRELWNGINEKRGYGWEKNDYVWVVSFEKVKPVDVGRGD